MSAMRNGGHPQLVPHHHELEATTGVVHDLGQAEEEVAGRLGAMGSGSRGRGASTAIVVAPPEAPPGMGGN